MKEFQTGQIRNVALVAHHGVGKTSLAEAMLFLAKATNRLGRITDGTTLLDHAPDEIQRQITINLGLAQFEWAGHKVNLLDTPGYPDFVGDVYSALRVADAAILMLRANAGVEVGTEVVWEVLKQEKTPVLVVVNMMDKEHAGFAGAVRSLHDRLGLNAVPAQLPIGEAEQFHGIVDLIENRAFTFSGKGMEEKSAEIPIPDDMKAAVAGARAKLMEEAATGDEEKMAQGIARLHEEDPTLSRHFETSTHESLIYGMGDLQLEIMVERLKKRFGVEVLLSRPHVPYRETVRGKAQDEYRHKKQTGGRGQFGEVHLRLEPLKRGEGFKFLDEIKGGTVPNQYIPAVEKGVIAGMERGPLAGCPVVDVQVALFFGKYHDVDSSEMAFKIAAETCFHQVMLKANPVLLEPIDDITVRVPEEFLGDVMGDLSSRRGRIQGTETDGHYQVVKATVPMAESYKYATHLRSLTQGRGMHASKFSHYEEVPRELAEKVVAAAKAEKEAAAHAS